MYQRLAIDPGRNALILCSGCHVKCHALAMKQEAQLMHGVLFKNRLTQDYACFVDLGLFQLNQKNTGEIVHKASTNTLFEWWVPLSATATVHCVA